MTTNPSFRHESLQRLRGLVSRHPVVALLGARQVGKTTLARLLVAQWPGPVSFFDLEDPGDLARLAEPGLVLRELRGLVVLDEVQRLPEIFSFLRVLADRPGTPARFLVLGSVSPDWLRQSSESLAGRLAYFELSGFRLGEVGVDQRDRLWLRGGFPRSFLADSDDASLEWRQEFIRTFLERDLPQLGVQIPPLTLRRFWTMVAHWHGQVWNGEELARAFGVAGSTVRRYLDLLAGALVLRLLPPWYENLAKRQVKSPKVYLSDSGLLHAFLGIGSREALEGHPKVGSSWEGFVIGEVVSRLGARSDEVFFWASHGGAELDLLVVSGGRRFGFELKRTETPKVTSSMRVALADLRLDRLDVIHAGTHAYPLADRVRAVPLARLLEEIEPLVLRPSP